MRTLLLASLVAASIQSTAPFRSGVEVVYLDVTVMDQHGAIVTGLTKDDFEIFDEGVRHEIALFSDQPAPIAIAVLIDASRSMTGDRLTAALVAADEVGKALKPDDRWSLFAFSSYLQPVRPWGVFAATDTISGIRATGGTELFRSVAEMVPHMRRATHRKRALLIVTDGADNVVQMAASSDRGGVGAGAGGPPSEIIDYSGRAIDALRGGEVLVYALGIDRPAARGVRSRLHVPSLEKLAEPTGGAVAVARTDDELRQAAIRLTDELRQQYTLGFTPMKALDGKYRRLKVVARSPSHRVRTRAGYLAAKSK